jgi:hypothetical protein
MRESHVRIPVPRCRRRALTAVRFRTARRALVARAGLKNSPDSRRRFRFRIAAHPLTTYAILPMLTDSLRRVLAPFLLAPAPAPTTARQAETGWEDSQLEQSRTLIDALPPEERPWQSEAQGSFQPLRRSIIAILPRQPFVDWLRTRPGEKDASLKLAREHNSISFLIPYRMNTHETVRVVPEHWPRFFAQMLERCSQNPEDWPADRTWEMFQQWFEIEYRDTVLDIAEVMSVLPAEVDWA